MNHLNHHLNHHLNKSLNGLYVITPESLSFPPADWMARVEAAVRGGAKVVQFRDKYSRQKYRLEMAMALLEICRAASVPLIINDDVLLAKKIQADGVHLGQDDQSIEQARNSLGEHAIIGVSCYNQLDLAKAAQQAGADYVAFGRFFPSLTKPEAVQAPLSILSEARQSLRIPIVAIGGITADNAPSVIQAGASAIAVIEAVFSKPDAYQAAQEFSTLFLQRD
jgi:thiamine-phosphate pyrophosphorylase